MSVKPESQRWATRDRIDVNLMLIYRSYLLHSPRRYKTKYD
jgi:hypothetical protein